MHSKNTIVVEQPFWLASTMKYLKIPYLQDNILEFYHLEHNSEGSTHINIVPDGYVTIVFERTSTVEYSPTTVHVKLSNEASTKQSGPVHHSNPKVMAGPLILHLPYSPSNTFKSKILDRLPRTFN